MKKNEVKAWIKEHKTEILIGTGTTIVVAILGYLGIKSRKTGKTVSEIIGGYDQLDIKLDSATVTDMWSEDGLPNMILNDFRVRDIGVLGKDLIKNVPNVTEDTLLTCIMGVCKE